VVAAPLSSEEDLAASDDAFTGEFLERRVIYEQGADAGEIREHSAGNAKGSESTWSLDLELTEARELRAVSTGSDTEGGLPWVLMAGVAAGVVAFGAIAWRVRPMAKQR